MRANSLRCVISALALTFFMSATEASAAKIITYAYTGNPFVTDGDSVTPMPPPDLPFTNADALSGTITIDCSLTSDANCQSLPSQENVSAALIGFSFGVPGVFTTSDFAVAVSDVLIGTDALGNLTDWFVLFGDNLLNNIFQTVSRPGIDRDAAFCDFIAGICPGVNAGAEVLDNPGTWRIAAAVPEPAPILAFGLGLLFLGWRLRAKQA